MHEIQIDITVVRGHHVLCNLHTGKRCIQIIMLENDYTALKNDGFFIRDGKEADSAGVLNTTNTFKENKPK